MVAIDTNVLFYAEGEGEAVKQRVAREVLEALPRKRVVIPAQVLAELFRALVGKAKLPRTDVRSRVSRWGGFALVTPTLPTTIESAFDLATEHGLQVFDAVVLSSASEAGCQLLLSEDMQDGFVWRGVTVVNPFARTLHPLLADALRG